mgnify:CR=1 FL=1
MSNPVLTVLLLTSSFSILGYGIAVISWAVLSALTERVGKPTADRLSSAFLWAALSCVVITFLFFLTAPSPLAVFFMLLASPAAMFAAIGGACYKSSSN